MIATMVVDMIEASRGQDYIEQTVEVRGAMHEFRQFMFARVYNSSTLREERRKGQYIVQALFDYYMPGYFKTAENFLIWANGNETQAVVDYISGLTDNYAIDLFEKLFVPTIDLYEKKQKTKVVESLALNHFCNCQTAMRFRTHLNMHLRTVCHGVVYLSILLCDCSRHRDNILYPVHDQSYE